MALQSGMAAQFGFAEEGTYGTAVTVTRFVPLVDESLETEKEFLESGGIIAGARVRRSTQWHSGLFRHEGDIGLELYDRSIGLLLEHALGSDTTSGTTAPFTHTFSPGDLSGKGLTAQIGRPGTDGTVHPFTYAGVKVASAEIAVQTGELATLGLTLVAQTMTTATALETFAPQSGISPIAYVNGSFSLAGSSLCVRSATVAWDNMLDTERLCIGQDYIDEPLESELREITGTVELEFPDLVHWERFYQGTEGALQLVVSSPSSATVTVDANVRTDAFPVTVDDRGLLVVSASFSAVGTDSDASALSITYECPDTTP